MPSNDGSSKASGAISFESDAREVYIYCGDDITNARVPVCNGLFLTCEANYVSAGISMLSGPNLLRNKKLLLEKSRVAKLGHGL